MPSSIENYRELIEKPWGRMFYDMIFRQLNVDKAKPLHILDFGAGFCVTANHYAQSHHVTAIEPNTEMLDLKVGSNAYHLIVGGIEKVKQFKDESFDLIICHNVLEYASEREQILQELARVLKRNGKLSIVKHNLAGRILANAVFDNNPKEALELFNYGDNESNLFGNRHTYSNQYLIDLTSKWGLTLVNILGIRTFFALSSDHEIKFTDEWYDHMLDLEMNTCEVEEYKNIAFFHHLIFFKEQSGANQLNVTP